MSVGKQIDLSPISIRKAVQYRSVLTAEVSEKLVLPTLPASAGPSPTAKKNATPSPRATKHIQTRLLILVQTSNNTHAAALMACDARAH